MKIQYVKKEKLFPYFGIALYEGEKIYVRKDLPKSVKDFVLEHEKYHIYDYRRFKKTGRNYPIIWWEVKASIYGFVKHPLGAILTFLLNLKRLPKMLFSYFYPKKYNDSITKIEKRLNKK